MMNEELQEEGAEQVRQLLALYRIFVFGILKQNNGQIKVDIPPSGFRH